MGTRQAVIVGNWKMNKTISEALQFVNELVAHIRDPNTLIYLAVPSTCLAAVAEEVCEFEKIVAGAQDISEREDGSWTGDVSARMVREAGADFVLLGHSERRLHHHETNRVVNTKLKLALLARLQPVVCVGETLREREDGKSFDAVGSSLKESLLGISKEDVDGLMIAYEPVWAIGTGNNAIPQDVQKMHAFCRQVLEELWGEKIAQKIQILYGGSVKPENAHSLLTQPDVDGLLVGGASLNVNTFSQIVNANVNHQVI